ELGLDRRNTRILDLEQHDDLRRTVSRLEGAAQIQRVASSQGADIGHDLAHDRLFGRAALELDRAAAVEGVGDVADALIASDVDELPAAGDLRAASGRFERAV